MNAKELFEAGKVQEAEKALAAHLRDHPTDTSSRLFLFTLLCFQGLWERAEKHLTLLGEGGPKTEMGAMLYYGCIQAEKQRHEVYRQQAFPKRQGEAPAVAGMMNGKPFKSITDADPDLGTFLEVFSGVDYLWVPYECILSVQIAQPANLRDTLWAPALLLPNGNWNGPKLGEVYLPTIYPFSAKDDDPNVWLGRVTAWLEDEDGQEFPTGQRVLLVDGEEVPFLEIRNIQFSAGMWAPSAEDNPVEFKEEGEPGGEPSPPTVQ